ncbi:PQQ-dependent dehydrogenase, methanol/ethanol family [Thermus oshimai]
MATTAALALAGGALANPELLFLQQDPAQWAFTSRTYNGWRYSPLNQIHTGNVRNLRVAWTFALGIQEDGVEGEPLVVGNLMFVVAPWPHQVYALDLRDGSIRWIYEPKLNDAAKAVTCCGLMQRGWAYADGKLIFNTVDGQTIALDAQTGKEVWKTQVGDIGKQEVMTAPPLVAGNNVIVGMAGGEFGNRGWVTALDLKTGQIRWRAYSTGPNEEMLIGPRFKPFYDQDKVPNPGVSTWFGDSWQRGTGTTWGYMTYDPELNLFYYGTSNGGPWNPKYRVDPSDPDPTKWTNKYVASVLARDATTGELIWAYQFTPQEQWDYDEVGPFLLVDLRIGGQVRKALLYAARNGFFFVLDRTTGEVLSATPYTLVNWASGYDLRTGFPIFDRAKMHIYTRGLIQGICPAWIGGKNYEPPAYSPRTGLVYFTTANLCMDQEALDVEYKPGERYVGMRQVAKLSPTGNHRAEFVAWDPVNQRRIFTIKEPSFVRSGVLATAGDLVFYHTLDGWFKAVHARTGEVLWQFRTGSGSYANPITYLGPDGKQYMAVLVGSKAAVANVPIDQEDVRYGFVGKYQRRGNYLFVFSLP